MTGGTHRGRTEPMPAEDALIARHFAPLATSPGAFGLRDDAASLMVRPGCDLVVTADAIVEGVHYLPDDPPATIARKALRVNLSDLAAKGAAPTGFVLALMLPRVDDAFLADFAAALGEDARQFACPLLGGDTVRTPGPTAISITAFGEVPEGGMIRRGGAAVGDTIFVSGTIGDAALGLALRKGGGWPLQAAHREHLIARYRVPQPRGALAVPLRAHAHAAMDVSDGLVGDLARMCRASGTGAAIEAGRVPLSDAACAVIAADAGALERVLNGGDDYEILCTVAPGKADAFAAAAAAAGVVMTRIGTVEDGGRVRVVGPRGEDMAVTGMPFSHF